MSLSSPFIHRPVGTTLLTVAITLAGALGFGLTQDEAMAVDVYGKLPEERP